jgi:hypothetical protein
MIRATITANVWLTLAGSGSIFALLNWKATAAKIELLTGLLFLFLFLRVLKRTKLLAGWGPATGALCLSFVTIPIWEQGMTRFLGDPQSTHILDTRLRWTLLAVGFVGHISLRQMFHPFEIRSRSLSKDETPEQSVTRVSAAFMGKSVFVDWSQVHGEDGPLKSFAESVMRAFENQIRAAGALVESMPGSQEFDVSFSWMDQPEFTFSSREGRRSSIRPVRWQTEGRSIETAMKDDALMQGLFFFALFVSGKDSA